MTNIKMEKKGSILTLTIDLSKVSHVTPPKEKNTFGKSYPGSVVIASSHGNVEIGDGLKLGLNLFKTNTEGLKPTKEVV